MDLVRKVSQNLKDSRSRRASVASKVAEENISAGQNESPSLQAPILQEPVAARGAPVAGGRRREEGGRSIFSTAYHKITGRLERMEDNQRFHEEEAAKGKADLEAIDEVFEIRDRCKNWLKMVAELRENEKLYIFNNAQGAQFELVKKFAKEMKESGEIFPEMQIYNPPTEFTARLDAHLARRKARTNGELDSAEVETRPSGSRRQAHGEGSFGPRRRAGYTRLPDDNESLFDYQCDRNR
jgi:hypothetical protein